MLIESAIGDSFGAGYEYVDPLIVNKFGNNLEYRQHPKHKEISPGKYTDDTQMAIAISEAIIENTEWDTSFLAEKFVQSFKRDERTGYSRNFYKILKEVNSGKELLDKLVPDSERSGAAMRAYPIGLYKNIKEVVEKSKLQATITHNTDNGIAAAVASALMTHFFAYKKGSKKELGLFLEFHCDYNIAWDKPYNKKVGEYGWMSVMAAITAIKESSKMTELLKKCISFTGDVDTVAAIAMSAGSFSEEIAQDLPKDLFLKLENDQYGKDYLIQLDNKLFEKFQLTKNKQNTPEKSSNLLKRFDSI